MFFNLIIFINFVLISQGKTKFSMTSCTVHQASPILGGFSGQTPSLSLTQTETSYQFLGPYDIVLQRPKSFKVGHFKANIEIKCPTLKLSGRGKTMLQGPKNWYRVTVWVKLNDGVCLENPPKIGLAYCAARSLPFAQANQVKACMPFIFQT